MIRAVLWDFGGVILSSPFEAFNHYEEQVGSVGQALEGVEIPDQERAADSRADAVCAVLLVAIAVASVIFWIAGH